MDTKTNKRIEIDIKELIFLIMHKSWIILLAAAAGAAVIGFINLYLITPVYTSTAKIYVINRQDDSKITYSDLQTGTQLTQDYMILATSLPVLEQVIYDTKVAMTTDELAGMISIVNPDGTRVLELSVTSYDPSLAKKLVDAVASASSEQLINIMEIQKVNVMEYGNVPSVPTGQNIVRSFVTGGLIGFIAAAAVIIFVHTANDNIRNSEDIEHYLGFTTLGILPFEGELAKNRHRYRHKKRKAILAG